MTKLLRQRIAIAFFLSFGSLLLFAAPPCDTWPSFPKHLCQRWHQIIETGNNELYFSGYAWHNRYKYTPEKRASAQYNEQAYGGGFGKAIYDEDDDWHGLYAIAFLDSHKHLEPAAGYSFLKMIKPSENTHLGAGFSVLVTMRPDIFGGYPFPGAAPLAGLTYKQLTVLATYIPGSKNIGNVLFLIGKWTF